MDQQQFNQMADVWWGDIKKQVLKGMHTYINNKMGVSKKTGKRFIEPTQEEVAEYVKSKDLQWMEGQSAANFWGFYASKGWMIGKNKMKDWQVCVGKSPWTEPKTEKKPGKPKYCVDCCLPKDQCKCNNELGQPLTEFEKTYNLGE